jgi:phosphoglycolate phosphatase-like HAD superfamily hydrolase
MIATTQDELRPIIKVLDHVAAFILRSYFGKESRWAQMNPKIECSSVIFDFDGTLADSMPFLEHIGVEVMVKYYAVSKTDARKRYKYTTGLPYEHQIEINFPDNPSNKKAVEEFERLKIERIFDQQMFSDSVPTVIKLHDSGFNLFVSSSTIQPTIVEYFERRDLRNYFKDIMGYRPGFEKGADHFNHVKNVHNLDLDQTVFIGDSLKDLERSDGFCRFIAYTSLFEEEEFKKNGHNGLCIKVLSQLPGILSLSK